MFMVAWEGKAPRDRAEWMEILQAVFAGSAGSHRLRFLPGPNGWRFELESHDDLTADDSEMVANGPDTIRFNIAVALRERGKPIDPDWDPQGRTSEPSR